MFSSRSIGVKTCFLVIHNVAKPSKKLLSWAPRDFCSSSIHFDLVGRSVMSIATFTVCIQEKGS